MVYGYVDRTIELNLNGHTLTYSGSIQVEGHNTIIISGNGTINTNRYTLFVMTDTYGGGNVVIKNGTINGPLYGELDYPKGDNTLTIEGGTINAGYAVAIGMSMGEFTMTGGQIFTDYIALQVENSYYDRRS